MCAVIDLMRIRIRIRNHHSYSAEICYPVSDLILAGSCSGINQTCVTRPE
jgi:hypothetical protein